jgi:L-xylulokinase
MSGMRGFIVKIGGGMSRPSGHEGSLMEYLLGIDSGGTVTKAVLFDLTGHEVAAGSAGSQASTPQPRWVERDMDSAWTACTEAIRQAVAGVDPARIVGVGLAGHNDGMYLVDAALRPVRPAVLASDTRAESVLDGWQASGVHAAALPLIGQQPFAASPVAVLAWLAKHEPAALERTRWLLFCKDWLRLQLTGEIGTDPTEASASFTSVRSAVAGRAEYDDGVLDLFDLRQVADKRPPIHGSTEVVGAVTAAAAELTGLSAGTPVICGSHDVDAAAVGLGAVHPGALSIVAGTFSINQVVSTDLHTDYRWQARAFLQPGQLLNMSTSPASASTLDWFVRRLVGVDSFDFVGDEVAAVLDDPSDLLFLPYLYGSPMLPHATGGFVGLQGWHTRAHLLRALMEGVVCNHRLHIDALGSAFELSPVVRATGGGMRSGVWRQLFADGLGRTIEVPDTDEAGARGAAVLAGLGVGLYSDLDEAITNTVRIAATHEPDRRRSAAFSATYERFTAAIAALRPLWIETDSATS